MDKRKNWQFNETPDSTWTWQVTQGTVIVRAATTFKTLKDCVENAREHGYVNWNPEQERRQARSLGIVKVLTPEHDQAGEPSAKPH